MASSSVSDASGMHANAFKSQHDRILIVDFGSQYSHLIARRIRELKVYCEMFSCRAPLSALLAGGVERIRGVILSGGPSSVYSHDAPHLSHDIWSFIRAHRIPTLGICYGLQEMVQAHGGGVTSSSSREFGAADLNCTDPTSPLFAGMPTSTVVWMSHGDSVTSLPPGFKSIACTSTTPFACVSGLVDGTVMVGVQFHPEVSHTRAGLQLLRNFTLTMCGSSPTWSMDSFLSSSIASIQVAVGPTSTVIGAVSGGVDSTVAALLLSKSIGDRFHAVLVDNGLLRLNEAVQVHERLTALGVNLKVVDASAAFFKSLEGLTEPELKRKAIGATFIHTFESEALLLPHAHFLLQGTLYPDVIESSSHAGPSAVIKSHHNVGGLLPHMSFKLIEPLRELFKDEVRDLGRQLGLPEDVVTRHPFPGPGLAIRILGEVTPPACDILRAADDIFISELKSAGEYGKIGQAFAVLLPCKTVGVMGDARTYEHVLALRAVATSDYMTADWYRMPYDLMARVSSRICNEVRGVNRVVYDVSSKPPATIEWE